MGLPTHDRNCPRFRFLRPASEAVGRLVPQRDAPRARSAHLAGESEDGVPAAAASGTFKMTGRRSAWPNLSIKIRRPS